MGGAADIEERISRWSLLPVGNGEGIQVLRYNLNQVRLGAAGAAPPAQAG
jgi:hypothetical protein